MVSLQFELHKFDDDSMCKVLWLIAQDTAAFLYKVLLVQAVT